VAILLRQSASPETCRLPAFPLTSDSCEKCTVTSRRAQFGRGALRHYACQSVFPHARYSSNGGPFWPPSSMPRDVAPVTANSDSGDEHDLHISPRCGIGRITWHGSYAVGIWLSRSTGPQRSATWRSPRDCFGHVAGRRVGRTLRLRHRCELSMPWPGLHAYGRSPLAESRPAGGAGGGGNRRVANHSAALRKDGESRVACDQPFAMAEECGSPPVVSESPPLSGAAPDLAAESRAAGENCPRHKIFRHLLGLDR
jgi:hypothetical protein